MPNIILILLLSLSSLAVTAGPVPSAPKLKATAFYLQDFNSQSVLASKDAEQRLPPASLTKLMTAYTVFSELKSGNITVDDYVTISEKAWRAQGSRMFVEVGSQVKVDDLLRGMIIQSGNDASIALAEHTAGNESAFADIMNFHAQQLGLTQTHFVNATGLPDRNHYTTAVDLAKLANALIRDFPDFYPLYSEKQYTHNGITQYNRNKLLWRDDSVDGLKTGHTDAAGYCLISSALRGNMRLIAVVMGTRSEEARARESQALLNYGFRFFETHRLYGKGEALTEVRVWKGEIDNLQLGLDEDLYITIPRGQYDKLQADMELNASVMAPAPQGHAYGKINVKLGEELVSEEPLIALHTVNSGTLLQRAFDEVQLWFQ